MQDLNGYRVAILATDGYERSELMTPRGTFREAGAAVDVVSPKSGEIRSWDQTDWGDTVPVDCDVAGASVDDYDVLVLPGGQINPDKLRLEPKAVGFVADFAATGKPLAAICHGPWMLVEADVIRGRAVTSYPSIRTDLVNAGAEWTDQPVVTDGTLITSRNPGDLAAFCAAIADAVTESAAVKRSA